MVCLHGFAELHGENCPVGPIQLKMQDVLRCLMARVGTGGGGTGAGVEDKEVEDEDPEVQALDNDDIAVGAEIDWQQ